MSSQLMETVDQILGKSALPDRHSYFQIEKFIIGKEPTGQSQLWAIVREIQARKETVDQIEKDLADAEDNIELFDIKIGTLNLQIGVLKYEKNPDTELNIREREINIRKLQREKDSLIKSARKVQNRLKSIQEELAFLVLGYEKIVEKIGEMKPMDDEQSQKEMWNERLLEDFNLRMLLQRPLDPEFIKTVMCLNDDATVKRNVVSIIENIQKKMLADKRAQPQKPSITVKPNVVGKKA